MFNSCTTDSRTALCSGNRRLVRYTADSASIPETAVVEHHCLKYGKVLRQVIPCCHLMLLCLFCHTQQNAQLLARLQAYLARTTYVSIKTLCCLLTVPREMQNGCWSTSLKSPHLARVAGDARLSVTSCEADCDAVCQSADSMLSLAELMCDSLRMLGLSGVFAAG